MAKHRSKPVKAVTPAAANDESVAERKELREAYARAQLNGGTAADEPTPNNDGPPFDDAAIRRYIRFQQPSKPLPISMGSSVRPQPLVEWGDFDVDAWQRELATETEPAADGGGTAIDSLADGPTRPDWLPDASCWQPNYLSLPGACTWAYARSRSLTKWVEDLPEHERDSGNPCEAARGTLWRLKFYLRVTAKVEFADPLDAWDVVRRLMADGKIAADGSSIVRRGRDRCIEEIRDNEPIPRGKVKELCILTNTPGIEPRYSLGPEGIIRFQNGQGQYWHSVSCRAEDVFREFPPRPLASTACEAIGEANADVPQVNASPPTPLTPPDETAPPTLDQVSQRGRRKGSGKYVRPDAVIVARIREMILRDPPEYTSPWAAAMDINADIASGPDVAVESKVKRVVDRYYEKYPEK